MTKPRMTVGNILQGDAPLLRLKARLLELNEIETKPIKDIIAHMSAELAKHDDGVAIAAPQIGESLQIFVVSWKVFALKKDGSLPDGDSPVETKTPHPKKDLIFINPKIIKLSKKRHWIPEGCLSVRFQYGEARRAEKATVEAYNEHGKKITRGGSGLLAQIFQHEVDHLHGKLFIDHARKIEHIQPEGETIKHET